MYPFCSRNCKEKKEAFFVLYNKKPRKKISGKRTNEPKRVVSYTSDNTIIKVKLNHKAYLIFVPVKPAGRYSSRKKKLLLSNRIIETPNDPKNPNIRSRNPRIKMFLLPFCTVYPKIFCPYPCW